MATRDPIPTTIPGALRAAATTWPDLDALVGDGLHLTFAQLDAEVDRWAAALAGHGIGPGDRVAIWTPNIALFVPASFAAYRAGATLVPISSRYRGDEAADILARSRAKLLFTITDFGTPDPLTMLAGHELPDLVTRVVLSGPVPAGALALDAFLDRAGEFTEPPIGPDDISDIIFTSGTTGRPKGAMLRHSASVHTYLAWSERVGLRVGDRHLVVFPFFHTSGLKSGILACVLRGAAIHPMAVFDVEAMMRRVVAEQITMLPGPPTVFQTILAHPDLASFDLSSVRTSVTGAAVVPVEIIRRMRADLKIPDVVTGYGLTETTGTISMCHHDDPPEVVANTAGTPLPGLEVKIVDGEIWVRGYNLMAGYLDDPAATAETITPDGFLKTGDIGHLDEAGRIHVTDRKKEMFIVGGFNAYPAEIEARLLEHPDIVHAAVFGVPDERMGEVGSAVLVLRPGGTLDPDTLTEQLTPWCRERMANFKVPRAFRAVAELALNATGKIARAQLKAQILEHP